MEEERRKKVQLCSSCSHLLSTSPVPAIHLPCLYAPLPGIHTTVGHATPECICIGWSVPLNYDRVVRVPLLYDTVHAGLQIS